jgi:hypothetical protein
MDGAQATIQAVAMTIALALIGALVVTFMIVSWLWRNRELDELERRK